MKTIMITMSLFIGLQQAFSQQLLFSAGLDDVTLQKGRLTYVMDDSLPGLNQFQQIMCQPIFGVKCNVRKAPNRFIGIELGYFSSMSKQKLIENVDPSYEYHYTYKAPYKQLTLGISGVQFMNFQTFNVGVYTEVKAQYVFKSFAQSNAITIQQPEHVIYSIKTNKVHAPAYLNAFACVGQSLSKQIVRACYVEAGIREGIRMLYRNGTVVSEASFDSEAQHERQTITTDYHHTVIVDVWLSPFFRINYFMNRKKKNSH